MISLKHYDYWLCPDAILLLIWAAQSGRLFRNAYLCEIMANKTTHHFLIVMDKF